MPLGFDETEEPPVVDEEEPASSSVMFRMALVGEPRIALFVGFDSVSVAVSLPSDELSFLIVLLVSLLANVSVPLVTSKSDPAVAVPAVMV